MSQKLRSAIAAGFETVSLESQQMEVEAARQAEIAATDYVTGVEIPAESAEDAIAQTALIATYTAEASPKELRNGMPVKFSHGHGKIGRVFTAPFKLDGKNHHATKDAPLYLVKHDKGGKHSLHKASALSPRK